ncbi:Cadherin EGF LAG seven-pass G-type receptor [Hirschfeldia incana]|nr:Cadherin EGF LAG seven-pass G-type receptor [Hirschfeldia incana]
MGSVTPGDVHKDDPELEDEKLTGENGLLRSGSLLTHKRQQCRLVSNSGKWLQLVKNGPKGSLSRATSFLLDNKIPRHLVSLDEKYLRRCLDLINISAFKSASHSLSMNLAGSKMSFASSYSIDSTMMMIPKEDVARLVFDPPLVDDSGDIVISPTITGCKRLTTHMVDDKPLLCDGDDVVSLSSTNSVSSSSSSSYWSPSSTVSQGTLQFTMKDNKTPRFVFSLDDQKEIVYVASLSTSSFGFDRSSLEYSYLIHLKKGHRSEPQHLVGKLKVSTSFSVSSENETIVERQFVLFSSGGNPQSPSLIKKSKGLSKKVVDALKSTTRVSRQRSDSRFSRASSVADSCSWEPFQEPDLEEPVSLLDNNLPPNLETLAVVVREQYEEEKIGGGWGMKFLKKTPLAQTKHSTSIDVVIPSGVHGGPRSRNSGGPSSLVERWKSGGRCDCSGWDLGCPLTVFKGQAREDQSEGQCNLFELFTEGSKHGIPGLRIMSVRDGLYFVQFQAEMSVLQSFSIALAYIHSQSQKLRPWSSGKCTEKVN